MNQMKLFSLLLLSLIMLSSCNSNPTIDKKFITLNSIQIGDDIKNHNNFILGDNQEGFFDIYKSKKRITINKLEGTLYLYVLKSKIEKIKFNSEDSFLGSTNIAPTIFDAMLEEREQWLRDAMLNYNISEWDYSKKLPQYTKQDFLHQYDLEAIKLFGTQMGWYLSYTITSKSAIIKEQQGKKDNLDFGSTKKKKNVSENKNLKINKKAVVGSNIKSSEEKHDQTNKSKQKLKKILIINVDNLRVRTTPSLDGEKIENLTIDSEVEFIEKSDNTSTVIINDKEITEYWYKVKTSSGNIGWIHGCCFNK